MSELEAAAPRSPASSPAAAPGPAAFAIALAPLWAALLALVLSPGFLDPLGDNPPGILGVPLGLVLVVAVGVLTVLGLVVLGAARSRRGRVLAIVAFTIPALFLLAYGPAVIRIMQNLG